jgi:hypothetical protein
MTTWSFSSLLELILNLVGVNHVHALVSVVEMVRVSCTLSCNVATI